MRTEEEVLLMLESLRTGEETEAVVHKDDFLLFRSILMRQPDKNNFVGRAKKGGVVTYTYHRPDGEEGGKN